MKKFAWPHRRKKEKQEEPVPAAKQLSKEEEEAQYQELIQRFLQHSAITPDEKK